MAPPCRLRPKAGRSRAVRRPQTRPAMAPAAMPARRNSIGSVSQPASAAYLSAAATPNISTSRPIFTGTLPSNSQPRTVATARSSTSGSCGPDASGASASTRAAIGAAAAPGATTEGAGEGRGVARAGIGGGVAAGRSGGKGVAVSTGPGGLATSAAGSAGRAAACPGSRPGAGSVTGAAVALPRRDRSSTRARRCSRPRILPRAAMAMPSRAPNSAPATNPNSSSLASAITAPSTAPSKPRIQLIPTPTVHVGRV